MSPTSASEKDYFFNVLQVGDADGAEAVATEDGGLAVFNGEAGEYTLHYENATAIREFVEAIPNLTEGILIRVNGRFVYSEADAVISDGEVLVPKNVVLKKLGKEVDESENEKLVPIEEISALSGVTVKWNEFTKIVDITTKE